MCVCFSENLQRLHKKPRISVDCTPVRNFSSSHWRIFLSSKNKPDFLSAAKQPEAFPVTVVNFFSSLDVLSATPPEGKSCDGFTGTDARRVLSIAFANLTKDLIASATWVYGFVWNAHQRVLSFCVSKQPIRLRLDFVLGYGV